MNKNNGINSLLTLQLVIILLKVTGVEPMKTWSWLWVTSFVWIPFAIGVLIAAGGIILKNKKDA